MNRLLTISLLFAVSLGLTGCEVDDAKACRANVARLFPGAEIAPSNLHITSRAVPSPYHFIVRTKGGEVWVVDTMNASDNQVSSAVLLLNPPASNP